MDLLEKEIRRNFKYICYSQSTNTKICKVFIVIILKCMRGLKNADRSAEKAKRPNLFLNISATPARTTLSCGTCKAEFKSLGELGKHESSCRNQFQS